MVIFKKFGIGLFLLVLWAAIPTASPAQSSPGDSLTVENAVTMALNNSPALVQSAAGVQASNARVEQARTADLPTVAVEGSYVRIGPVPLLSFPGLGAFKLYPENNYDAHIGVYQKVYDFGRTSAAIDVSRSRVQSAELSGELIKSGLAYQTIQVFYSILYLQQAIQVEDQEIKTLQQHLELTRKRSETGTGTAFEVLTTEVRVAAAQNRLIDLANTLEKQQITMRKYLGVPDSTPVKLRGDFGIVAVNLNADSLTTIAFQQRPEYGEARAEENTASLQYRLSQVTDLPILNVNASYGVKNGYIPNLDALHGNWVAGVELQVPIYQGNVSRYREDEAKATLGGSQAHITETERQIAAEVRQAVSDLRSASGKIESSNLQVQQANEALAIAQKQFQAGSVRNLDVLDAETSLSQSHLLRLRAYYDYVSSLNALHHAVGTRFW